MKTTTIQIENPTKKLLNELKLTFHSKTYDEVIQDLMRKKTMSMYGKFAKGKKISAAEMLKGLRDASERV